MKGSALLVTFQKLGITKSRSRPACSDDNPHSEALFRTLKYRHGLARYGDNKAFVVIAQQRTHIPDQARDRAVLNRPGFPDLLKQLVFGDGAIGISLHP